MVEAEEPSPAPVGSSEFITTLTPGSIDLSLYISLISLSTGSGFDPSGRDLVMGVTTSRPDVREASALVFWLMAAARASAPCTTKCSPVMITLPGASAITFRRTHLKLTEG
jgi:hypothetical protein